MIYTNSEKGALMFKKILFILFLCVLSMLGTGQNKAGAEIDIDSSSSFLLPGLRTRFHQHEIRLRKSRLFFADLQRRIESFAQGFLQQ